MAAVNGRGYNDAKQSRDVFVAVKSVRNEKRNDDHVLASRQFSPIRHQRRFFHVSIEHSRVFSKRTDLFRFALRGDGAVFIQIGSVSNDQQTSLNRIDARCYLARALEQQLGHQWMISNRLTIPPELSIRSF